MHRSEKSYRIIAENVKDKLLPAKLAFLSVIKQVQRFLVSYQTDSPTIPFLYSDLSSLLRSVMERFVKTALLQAARNVQTVDVNNKQNLCEYTKIDAGFTANKICKNLLSTKKMSKVTNNTQSSDGMQSFSADVSTEAVVSVFTELQAG